MLVQTRVMASSDGASMSPGNCTPANTTERDMSRSGFIKAVLFCAIEVAVLFSFRSAIRWISRIRTRRAALSAMRRYSTTW
ncbi:hypothetical protein D3C76_1761880 [compost metagenome]